MRTYNVKISSGEVNLLHELLRLQREIVSHASEIVFKERPTLDIKHVHDCLYYKLKDKFPQANSQILIKCEQEVLAGYKSISSNDQPFNKPLIKKNLSLRLDKRICKFKPNNTLDITTREGRRPFEFNLFPVLTELLSKGTPCDPLIFERDGKMWLALSFNEQIPLHVENSVLGVDLGIKRLAVTSEGVAIVSKPHLKRKRKVRYLKSLFQSVGTKSSRRHLKKIRRKERNQTKNMVHHVSNEILKTESNIIAMEDLTKIKPNTQRGKKWNNRHSQIPYYLIKEILSYKAPLKGKKVVTVNPAYTSQNDYRGVKRGKRQGCRYYAIDGKVFDADWNAAINIANRLAKSYKLPVSFSEPIDGKLNFIWQGDVSHPKVCQSKNVKRHVFALQALGFSRG